jgi:glycosyltransferase involved in cell wall biosynthesis
MKVLITHELFPPESFGGGEILVYEMAKNLKKAGICVEILTTGNPKIKNYDGIKTIRLPINRYMMNFAWKSIQKHAKKFDLIQTNNYNACLASYVAGKKIGKPVICHVHGIYTNQWIKMRGLILGTLSKETEKFQLKQKYNKIVFSSNYAQKEGLNIGIPKKQTIIIPPGIPREGKYKPTKKQMFVLHVGRLSKQKGLDQLIAAAVTLPEINFKLIGRGEDETRLKKIAPKNVEFLGYLSDKDVIKYYNKAAIFCLPSLGEGFGLVLTEAMASGCAIISTIPLDFEGIRIEQNNTRQLINAIYHLYKNPKLTQKMGKKNLKLSKKYNWKKFTKAYMNLYEKLV